MSDTKAIRARALLDRGVCISGLLERIGDKVGVGWRDDVRRFLEDR